MFGFLAVPGALHHSNTGPHLSCSNRSRSLRKNRDQDEDQIFIGEKTVGFVAFCLFSVGSYEIRVVLMY